MRSLQLCMVALFVAALAALTAVAQEAPSFRIEKIEVRGARFASESVIARETLLVPGHVYSEPQLRAAMARVNRLPFVLDSSFAIEKGSDRGEYVLVITIVETKPLFVEAESMFETSSGYGDVSNQESVRSGARWFVGSSSLIHASTDFDDNYEAGITQYNIFGRPGYVTLNVRWTRNQGESSVGLSDVEPSPELRFGFPIKGNDSIQGEWSYVDSSYRSRYQPRDVYGFKGHNSRLAWVRDTTDDPVLPANGSILRTGIEASVGSTVSTWMPGGERQLVTNDTWQAGVFGGFNRYRPLNDAVSLMYGANARLIRAQTELDPPLQVFRSVTMWDGGPEVGISASLWSDRLTRRFGDLRWETRIGYTFAEGARYSVDAGTASTAIVQRNVWGTLRLGFTYRRWDRSELD